MIRTRVRVGLWLFVSCWAYLRVVHVHSHHHALLIEQPRDGVRRALERGLLVLALGLACLLEPRAVAPVLVALRIRAKSCPDEGQS
jgi:hypothetical protein